MARIGEVGVMVNVYPAGLTMRDYFAAMALTGVVSSARGHHLEMSDVVDESYRYADAMMERRDNETDEFLHTPIEEMGLSARAVNALSNEGCKTIADVTRMSKRDILCMRNIGEVTANEILRSLNSKCHE